MATVDVACGGIILLPVEQGDASPTYSASSLPPRTQSETQGALGAVGYVGTAKCLHGLLLWNGQQCQGKHAVAGYVNQDLKLGR